MAAHLEGMDMDSPEVAGGDAPDSKNVIKEYMESLIDEFDNVCTSMPDLSFGLSI